jgi:threonine synthase
MVKPGIIKKYQAFLPPIAEEHIVTLGEGDTPLIRALVLEEVLALLGARVKVYLKFEGANPTGSFKDRGMTMAISEAKSRGIRKVICASTGNTSASAAAYAARAGMECEVYLPKGKVAAGKLTQAKIYGAKIVEVEGNFDDALATARKQADKSPEIELVNSTNPFRLQGQKTAAFEICDDLTQLMDSDLKVTPDYHCISVGNGGNITAYWMGYKEYCRHGCIKQLPRMLGFQAEGSAPIVRGEVVKKPETVATAIRIGNPVHWQNVLNVVKDSGGGIFSVTDDEILYNYALLAMKEQVFCEPASAASVAGLIQLAAVRKVKFQAGEIVVCTLTGHGLKDPATATEITNG